MTTITRENYAEYLTEPDLSKSEWSAWWAMRAAIRHAYLLNDESLFDFIGERTVSEQAAYDSRKGCTTPDWSDMVVWVDNLHRLRRAEIAAWREWQEVTR